MGFDMFWATSPNEEEAALEEESGQDYYRLTNVEMSRALTLMCILGLVDDTKIQLRLPRPVDFDLTYVPQRYDEDGNEIHYDAGSTEEQYLCARVAARDGDSGGLIPVYKLRSNDGWLVTSSEIERSLAVYDKHFADREAPPSALPAPVSMPVPAADGRWTCDVVEIEWWGEWIEWLRAAAAHDGFRVF